MSIQTELSRILDARNQMRNKLRDMGILKGTESITDISNEIYDMADNKGVSATVKEGQTYTIPKGYHNGSGTVTGVAGGGNYELQSKTITPTKKQQNITPDEGKYGLDSVTVEPIPEAYQDVTSVTATAPEVLDGRIVVDKNGSPVIGTMPNHGGVKVSLDLNPGTDHYPIPAGYHDGSGEVEVNHQQKTATPTKSKQTITGDNGYFLSQVEVAAIPDEYADVRDVTAARSDVLVGKTIVGSDGAILEGNMPNKGNWGHTLKPALKDFYVVIPEGYHDGTGEVVAELPDTWKDVSTVDATAETVLAGKKIVTTAGAVTGTMPDNGAINKTISGLDSTSITIPAGYTTGGTVSLTNDIETALAAI